MCRHMYDWNIVNCDVKQPIHLTSPNQTHIHKKHTLGLLKDKFKKFAARKKNIWDRIFVS